MKKNFMAIASLLIAAMLLVVSCAPEAKVEDDGLVNASFSVAYGKDVNVSLNKNVNIVYTYTLSPTWSKFESGVDIYVEKPSGEIGTTTIGANIDSVNLGRVTPGLWKIEVEGKLSGTNDVVMKGSTKAYFRNESSDKKVSAITSATVYVAPVKDVNNGKLSISIQMEDLGDSNANKIKYSIDGAEPITISGTKDSSKNICTYVATRSDISSGYHKITFTVDGYDGGVTKSFLMLPGSVGTVDGYDVEITGSVVPSKFATTGASINVINIPDKAITVGSGENTKTFNGSTPYAPLTVTALSVPVSIEEYKNEAGLKFGDSPATPSYTWYVDGKEKLTSNLNEGEITIDNDPGDYTITCVIKFTFNDENNGEYTIYGHEKQAAVVRLENKVATTTPSQGQ